MKLSDFNVINKNIDINEYLKFHNSVIDELGDKSWLGRFDKEKIQDIINDGGKIWIWQDENKEIACSIMSITATQKVLDKLELTNINPNEVYECGAVLVNKKYRGNRLQLQMLKLLEEYTKNISKKHILTTIHPDNIYSINNFEKANYRYIKTILLSRGPRAIYLKDLL